LPTESLGVTFSGCPVQIEAIEPHSPLLKHGVFVGMLVDTITFIYGLMNKKKSHHEMDTETLVKLLKDYKASIIKPKCMIRFVAPHYTLTPPPIPSDLENVTEHDDVSDVTDEGHYGDYIDDDSYTEMPTEVTDSIPDKSLAPDTLTESTTDSGSSVEYDEDGVYEVPSSINTTTSQYDVYERYKRLPKSSTNIVPKTTSRPASSTKGKSNSTTSSRLSSSRIKLKNSSAKNKNFNGTTSRPSKDKFEKESSSLNSTTSRPSKDSFEKESSSTKKQSSSSKKDLESRLAALKIRYKKKASPGQKNLGTKSSKENLKKKSSSTKNSLREKKKNPKDSSVAFKGFEDGLWS